MWAIILTSIMTSLNLSTVLHTFLNCLYAWLHCKYIPCIHIGTSLSLKVSQTTLGLLTVTLFVKLDPQWLELLILNLHHILLKYTCSWSHVANCKQELSHAVIFSAEHRNGMLHIYSGFQTRTLATKSSFPIYTSTFRVY